MEPEFVQNGAQIDPGGSRGAPGTPSDVLGAPGRSPRRSGIDFGAILDKFWPHCGTVFASKMQFFKVVFGVAFGCVLAWILVTCWVNFGMIFCFISMILQNFLNDGNLDFCNTLHAKTMFLRDRAIGF